MDPSGPELGERDADLYAGAAIGASLPILPIMFLPEGGPLAIAVIVGCFIVGTYLLERSKGHRKLGKGLIAGAGGLLILGVLGWMLWGILYAISGAGPS